MNIGVVDGVNRRTNTGIETGWEQISRQRLNTITSAVKFTGLSEFREIRLTASVVCSLTAYMLWRANGDSASTYSGIGWYATNNPGSGIVSTAGAVGYMSHQTLSSNLVQALWLNSDPTRYRTCLWSAMQARVVGVVTYWSSGGTDWESTGQPIDTIDLYMSSGTFLAGAEFRMEGLR